jgi:hypothetical protein
MPIFQEKKNRGWGRRRRRNRGQYVEGWSWEGREGKKVEEKKKKVVWGDWEEEKGRWRRRRKKIEEGRRREGKS